MDVPEGLDIEDFKKDELEITVNKKGSKVYITWLGKSRSLDPGEAINPYLQGLISRLKGYELVIDFTKFEFLNSSTVPSIIDFASELDTNGINTHVYYNKNLDWQVATFTAFNALAQGMKNVKVEGR